MCKYMCMAQLTIYIDDETRQRIEAAAAREKISVSRWVKERLSQAVEHRWPTNYFDVFGSLSGTDLSRPEQPPE